MGFRQTKEFRELSRFLKEDLEIRGLVSPIYNDQVRSYLRWVELEKEAQADIRERGFNLWDEKRQSWQQNPSVSTMRQARQMALSIYKGLGYEDEAKKAKTGAGEDDEL